LQFFERFRWVEASGDLRVVFVEPIGRSGDLRERPAVSAEPACDVLEDRSAPFRSRRPLFWNFGRIIGWYLTGEANPIRLRQRTAGAFAVSCVSGASSERNLPISSRGCPSYLKLSFCTATRARRSFRWPSHLWRWLRCEYGLIQNIRVSLYGYLSEYLTRAIPCALPGSG
jgi:hypothetical protein